MPVLVQEMDVDHGPIELQLEAGIPPPVVFQVEQQGAPFQKVDPGDLQIEVNPGFPRAAALEEGQGEDQKDQEARGV